MTAKIKTTLIVLGLIGACARSAIIYVDINAVGDETGADWNHAYTDLQPALAASTTGDEIWVAQGIYVPGANRTDTFQLQSEVKLYGGFATGDTFNDRNWKTKETVLSGDIGIEGLNTDNCYHVVTGTNNVYMNGFAIRDGFADGSAPNDQGGGYHHPEDQPGIVLESCLFEDNFATNRGGAVYIYKSVIANADMRVTDCLFRNNQATVQGGAIALNTQNASFNFMIEGSTFIGNESPNTVTEKGTGGAIDFYNAYPQITNCIFSANSAREGGAIYCKNVNYRTYTNHGIFDCIFSANNSTYNGGALMLRGSMPIRNCVFTGNTSDHSGGGAVMIGRTDDAANVPITGNLFAGNRGGRYGGGMEIYGSGNASQVVNCIFAYNEQTTSYDPRFGGGGLISRSRSDVRIRNTIFHENKSVNHSRGDQLFAESNGTGTVSYCAIEWDTQNVTNATNGGVWIEGSGNISDDPLLAPGAVGTWTADAVYDPSTGQTTLTDTNASWTSNELRSMGLNPSTAEGMLQYYVAGNSATSVKVWGDATAGLNGKNYRAYDYHLQSRNGRWQSGLSAWVTDSKRSPCIDAGDPADGYSLEPGPNGKRINIGLYGGTATASMSDYPGTSLILR